MQLQAFQQPELRNSQDEIIQQGTYGKNTALANSQNTGVIDYINNNLQVLFNGFNETVLQSKIANNLTTTQSGYVLDARQGKVLNDKVTTSEGKISTLENQIAGTSDSGLKTKITANETAITTLNSQMAGTTTSALKEQIANLGLSVVNGELSITYNV